MGCALTSRRDQNDSCLLLESVMIPAPCPEGFLMVSPLFILLN